MAEMCSAIQSSAASAVSPTKTKRTFDALGGLIGHAVIDGLPLWGVRPVIDGTYRGGQTSNIARAR